jgi:hypothetical protein
LATSCISIMSVHDLDYMFDIFSMKTIDIFFIWYISYTILLFTFFKPYWIKSCVYLNMVKPSGFKQLMLFNIMTSAINMFELLYTYIMITLARYTSVNVMRLVYAMCRCVALYNIVKN